MSTKRAIKFQLNESKNSILIFWSVVIIIDIFAIFINKYTGVRIGIMEGGTGSAISILGVNILAIVVYLISYSYELYYKRLPICLSFSMVRKDFFKSIILNNILVSLLFAVIQSILMKIDPIFTKFAGRIPLYDLEILNIETDSVIFIMIYFFIAFLLFTTIWNLIAALNYKFGSRFWIGLLILSMVSSLIQKISVFDLILPGDWLNIRLDALQFIKFSIITIILYIGIYFVTINTNIKNNG